jgi:hypothetical protein
MGDMTEVADRREVDESTPVVSRQVPEQLPATRAQQASMMPSAGLASTVGNAAFQRVMVSRLPAGQITASRTVSAADTNALREVEAKLARVSQNASARGTQILTTSDTCVRHLQEAKNHVGAAGRNYRAGHDAFTAVLRRADAEYEFDKSVEDAVQGILVAAVVAVLLPETLATGAAVMGLRAMASSTSSTLTSLGLRGMVASRAGFGAAGTAADAAVGEVAEMGAGAVAGSTRNDPGRPSDSAAAAGPSTTDKFEEVFGHLDRMVDALPALGVVGNGQKDLALAAEEISRTSVQLRAGDPVETTVAVLQQRAEALDGLDAAGARAMADVTAMENRMLTLKNQALTVRADSPAQVEDQLWMRWIAGLQGGANEMLDNDVLENYLGPEGKNLWNIGSYMSDSDQGDIVSAQQRRWLISQGLEPGADRGVTNSRFKAQQALQALRSTVVGKTGRLVDSGHIAIDGKRYDYPRNAGELPAGTEMIALHVIIKPHLQGDVLIDVWDEDDFDVYCNPVNQPNAPTPVAAGATP